MKSITAPLREDKGTPEEPAEPEETTVTDVAVNPAIANVIKGGTQPFTAVVTGTGSPPQTVTWSIVETTSAGTDISTAGLLTVDAAETATSLTIRATSTVASHCDSGDNPAI
jgi:hypothetical protein